MPSATSVTTAFMKIGHAPHQPERRLRAQFVRPLTPDHIVGALRWEEGQGEMPPMLIAVREIIRSLMLEIVQAAQRMDHAAERWVCRDVRQPLPRDEDGAAVLQTLSILSPAANRHV